MPMSFIDQTRPSAEALALYRLFSEIQKTYVQLMAFTDRTAARLGTTGSRIMVLSTISLGPVTVSAVARKMAMSRQNVQRATDALVREGLVGYLPNPNHRRAKLVQLTDHGSEVMREWVRVGGESIQQAADRIPGKRIALATQTLEELYEQVSALTAEVKPPVRTTGTRRATAPARTRR